MRDPIDDALGLGPERALPQIEVFPPDSREKTSLISAEDDREFARRNIRDSIAEVKDALSTIITVTASTGSPKEAEALANLFDKFVAANETLVKITDIPAKVANGSNMSAGVINNTQNVVMVGSGDDILRVVKKMRGEEDEEDDLER